MDKFFSLLLSLRFRHRYARTVIWSFFVITLSLFIALFLFQGENVTTQTVGWEKNFNLSSFKLKTREVSAAARGNYIAAVHEGTEGDKKYIFASVSFNGGASFLAPIKVADIDSKVESSPHVAVSGRGEIAVSWHVFREEEFTNRIFITISKDMGANWTPPRKLDMGLDMEMLPHVYYDGEDILHLFFQGDKDNSFNLYHARSVDGEKFELDDPIIELSGQIIGAFFPSIHVKERKFFIVWQGRSESYIDDLFFIRSFNGGKSWGGKEKLTRAVGSSVAPSVLLHRDNLYITYQNNEKGNWEIRLMKGMGTGEMWNSEAKKVSSSNVNCYAPVIVPVGDDCMILWYDGREGNNNIYARKYIVAEDKFGDEVRLSHRDIDAKKPKAVSVENRVIAMWEEGGVIIGKSTDIHVDPPVVYSETHPEGVWSKNPYAIIKWKKPSDESGIVSYRTMYTMRPDPRPFVDPPLPTREGTETQQIITELGEGISYFHIRAEDGAGNLSRTVHYKIQVSINPITLPVVVSPSHPQGQPSQSKAPIFRWLLANRDDADRLKGFYYTLTKDYFSKPDTFTTDFEKSFDNLEEGRYFFRIAAVDKTNRLSEVTTYDIIVGKAEELDPDLLKRIALNEQEPEDEVVDIVKKQRTKRLPQPGISIQLPFDPSKPYRKSEFQGILVTKDIPRDSIVGFSVLVERKKSTLPASITTKNGVLAVRNLTDGDYFVGAKCRYFTYVGGIKQLHWTDSVYTRFDVQLSETRSPLESTLGVVARRVVGFPAATAVFFMALAVSIVSIGYGRRLTFGAGLFRYRLSGLIGRFKNHSKN